MGLCPHVGLIRTGEAIDAFFPSPPPPRGQLGPAYDGSSIPASSLQSICDNSVLPCSTRTEQFKRRSRNKLWYRARCSAQRIEAVFTQCQCQLLGSSTSAKFTKVPASCILEVDFLARGAAEEETVLYVCTMHPCVQVDMATPDTRSLASIQCKLIDRPFWTHLLARHL